MSIINSINQTLEDLQGQLSSDFEDGGCSSIEERFSVMKIVLVGLQLFNEEEFEQIKGHYYANSKT